MNSQPLPKDTQRDFPIIGSVLMASVPWTFLAPHECQAQRNFSQSLKWLAGRGGIAPAEAIDIVKRQRWGTTKFNPEQSASELINLVREWRAKQLGQA